MKKTISIIAIMMVLYACASKLYVPSAVNVEKAKRLNPAITENQLKVARSLYISHCSSCHNLHLPHEYTRDQWIDILNKMQPKAKITDQQKALLLIYLTSE
ncbi:MAG: hypothetical protein K6T34_07895 [Thermoflavifilum sp.]|nr:hypothetical protein [Thermoflavifilum sp.]